MATANPRAVIGGNAPPDPIDTALEPYSDILEEVANWLDGATVENDGQLTATDALLKELKAARKAGCAQLDCPKRSRCGYGIHRGLCAPQFQNADN